MVLATGLEPEPYVERVVAFADVNTSAGIAVGCKLVQRVVAAFLAHLQLIIRRPIRIHSYTLDHE